MTNLVLKNGVFVKNLVLKKIKLINLVHKYINIVTN